MSTPLGHTLMGGLFGLREIGRSPWIWLWIVILANLPDIDLAFGFFGGNPNRYHHQWTHSLVFAAGVGAAVGIAVLIRRGDGLRWGLFSGLLVLSHLLMDLLTLDKSAPYGMQIFWPFDGRYVISPITIFRDVSKASESASFFRSLFCRHNGITLMTELLLVGPFLGLGTWARRRAKT